MLGRVLANLANDPPVNGAGPVADKSGLDERISTAIGQRAGRYEKLVPMWTFVETLQRRSTEAGEKVNQLYTSNREQLAEAFGAELTSMPGEKRERTLNALAMALTPEGWIVLRERLGLTVEQAARSGASSSARSSGTAVARPLLGAPAPRAGDP